MRVFSEKSNNNEQNSVSVLQVTVKSWLINSFIFEFRRQDYKNIFKKSSFFIKIFKTSHFLKSSLCFNSTKNSSDSSSNSMYPWIRKKIGTKYLFPISARWYQGWRRTPVFIKVRTTPATVSRTTGKSSESGPTSRSRWGYVPSASPR